MRLSATLPLAFLVSCLTPAHAATPTQEPPGPTPDHFLCYTLDSELPRPPRVKLEDQFPRLRAPVTVGKRTLLCNPVDKTYKGRTVRRNHPDAHLVCYRLPDEQVARKVTIENQLHDRPIPFHVEKTYVLCVPSGKSTGRDVPDIPAGLDHFECYLGHADAMHAAVGVHDQFVTQNLRITSMRMLCNPVAKENLSKPGDNPSPALRAPDEPKRHRWHLACYPTDPVPADKRATIHNQFDDPSGRVRTAGIAWLCVPSTKKDEGPDDEPPARKP